MAADPPRSRLALIVVALLAGTLLFWNVGSRYLWQDEAATAVMAERMLEHGKPLAYADGNLITMDVFREVEGPILPGLTATPEKAIATFAAIGDFKEDTTWIGQPWGQFVFAGASMALFGHDTFPARLPFVLAAILTVVLLFSFVRRRFDDPWMAGLAVVLCLGSVYWVLHARQCRYYATATLFHWLSFTGYLRWQAGKRLGATGFVAAAWMWFHNDFGSFWPVMLILGIDALVTARRDPRALRRVFLVFAVMALLVLPCAWYYELWGRQKEPIAVYRTRLTVTLYLLNQYQIPLLVLVALGYLFARCRRIASSSEWRPILLAAAILLGQVVFMTWVGPYGFYRYVVDCTPLAAMLMAFVLLRGFRALAPTFGLHLGWVLGLVLLVTPWLAEPGRRLLLLAVPEEAQVTLPPPGTLVRAEWTALRHELTNSVPDPNKLVVEFLRENLEPGQEVVINYEDVPLMFYLDNPVRGGIQCFRLEDVRGEPPRYFVLRLRPRFCHRAAYDRARSRMVMQRVDFSAPDIPWGNNPDPSGHYSRWADDLGSMGIWEVTGWR